MLKKSLILFMLVSLLIAVTGCEKGKSYAETASQNTTSTENLKTTTDANTSGSNIKKGDENSMQISITVGKQTFAAQLHDSKAARELRALLPLKINMKELNGNEKHGELPKSLTKSIFSPKQINTGDILLWGNSTLVIFYQDFPTQYSYTDIGKISDPKGLREALGSGNVDVTIH
jgi:hypothetical protein